MSDLYTSDELLVVALRNKRDLVEAERLVTQEGANVNAQNIRGETPLFMLVSLPNAEPAVRWLLAHNADPNIASRTGDTPLQVAVKQNNPRMVAALLEGGANPNLTNERGVSPLLEAVLLPEDKDRGLVRLFLEAAGQMTRDDQAAAPGAAAPTVDTVALALASVLDGVDPAIAQDVRARGVSVDPPDDPNDPSAGFGGGPGAPANLPPQLAAQLAALQAQIGPQSGLTPGAVPGAPVQAPVTPSAKEFLLTKPVHIDPVPGLVLDLDPLTDSRTTPLLAAVARKQAAAVRLLMDAGANPEAADHLGQGLLFAAVLADDPDILETIVSRTPWLNPNTAASSGTTPIAHAAARGSNPKIVSRLLDIGGDPNARSRNRFSGVATLLQSVIYGMKPTLPDVKERREKMSEKMKELSSAHKDKIKTYELAQKALAAGFIAPSDDEMAYFLDPTEFMATTATPGVVPGAPNTGGAGGMGGLGASLPSSAPALPPAAAAHLAHLNSLINGGAAATPASATQAPATSAPTTPAVTWGWPVGASVPQGLEDFHALLSNPWLGANPPPAPDATPDEADITAAQTEVFDQLKSEREDRNQEVMELIEKLFEKGADPAIRDDQGNLASLYAATLVGVPEMLKRLVATKVDITRPYTTVGLTALDLFGAPSLDTDDPATMELLDELIDLGFPVARPHWDEAIDGPIPPLEGREAPQPRPSLPVLFLSTGWWDGLKRLLERGATPNDANALGQSLVHHIVAMGSSLSKEAQTALSMYARKIVQKGNNPDDDADFQAQKAELERSHKEQLNERRNHLTATGADWNQQTTDTGVGPLHIAVKNGDVDWVDWLLNVAKVDPNRATNDGLTPAAIALQSGDILTFRKITAACAAQGMPNPAGGALIEAVRNASDDFRVREPLRRAITVLGALSRLETHASDQEILAPVRAAADAHKTAVKAIDEARRTAREAARERSRAIQEVQRDAQKTAKEQGLERTAANDYVRTQVETARRAQAQDLLKRLSAGEKIPGVAIEDVEDLAHGVTADPTVGGISGATQNGISGAGINGATASAPAQSGTLRVDPSDPKISYRDPAADMALPPPLVLADASLLARAAAPAAGSFIEQALPARDEEGNSALLVAAALGYHDLVRVLLQEGFDPNAPDANGNTALMQAVYNEDGEVIRLLRAANANPNQTNAAGQNAQDVASYVKSVYVHRALSDGDLTGPIMDVQPPEADGAYLHDAWRARLVWDGVVEAKDLPPWSQAIQATNEALEKEESLRNMLKNTPVSAGGTASDSAATGKRFNALTGTYEEDAPAGAPAAAPESSDESLLGLDDEAPEGRLAAAKRVVPEAPARGRRP